MCRSKANGGRRCSGGKNLTGHASASLDHVLESGDRGLSGPTPVKSLAALLREDKYERMRVAGNSSTPAEVLAALANDEDLWVRRSVAKNPSTPVDVLRELAKYEDEWVRWLVAQNPSSPIEVFRELAADEDEDVREAVAKNPSTPIDVLRAFASDGGYKTLADRPDVQALAEKHRVSLKFAAYGLVNEFTDEQFEQFKDAPSEWVEALLST